MKHLLDTIKSIAAPAIFYCAAIVFSPNLQAQTSADIQIVGAWVRTAVPGQQGTGGFMKITAKQDMKLVGISSPVAGVGEVHEMSMNAGVMSMRALPDGIDLPAGKTVELKPGGIHLMLLDLKQALPKDSTIPMTLLLKDKAGKDVKMEIKVPVSARAPAMGSAEQMDMHKH
jgi:periplasmic copper chaperone A